MTSGNDDGCTAPTNLNVRTTETSFQLQNCYDSVTYANDGFNIFVVIEPKDCFRNCNGAYKATFQENSQNNYYMCHCSYNDFAAVGNPVTCSPTSYFAYFHTRDAQASGLVRRKVREQRDLTARREIRYCPSGLTACNVDDTGNYECLDTSSELESCGGCLNGRYGNSSASVGIDCTNTGAAFGASTCVNGQCVISACKKGLKLVDGKCRS
ncbi:uncharacterized protein L201_003674 [Kwoniella dendrophila CBS 6074]|uniref:Protein CPL1-like domain-containing protein n=1 Tax=Kwoniella dendrophila CBS 6074 TaxID=1295534 RepID=A0AAX4JU82_9TREE